MRASATAGARWHVRDEAYDSNFTITQLDDWFLGQNPRKHTRQCYSIQPNSFSLFYR